MIYVEEKNFDRQLALLRYLSGIESCSICTWLYPESKIASFAGQSIRRSDLEPVTAYEGGVIPRHTELVKCNEGSIHLFSEARSDIVAHCDSLALYKSGETNWFAATIGHEGMCLVRDKSLLSQLGQAGFIVSTDTPDWW